MNWRAIYTNLPLKSIFSLPHPWCAVRQGQQTFLTYSADKKSRDYDTECSKHDPCLSTLWPKELNFSKVKWLVIYTNLPVNNILRLPHCWSALSQNQKMLLAPSTDKETRNHDTKCPNHHPTISSLTPKLLSLSKMNWWAIYGNLPVKSIVRLPHPWSA